MGDTPNRRAAAAAAREFLQSKVDRVGDLSEAARAIDAALEARVAADRHVTECQRAYGQARRIAIAAGWTDSELDQLGWPPEHGPQPRRRGRPRDLRSPRGAGTRADGSRRRRRTRVHHVGRARVRGTARASRQALPPMIPYPARPQ